VSTAVDDDVPDKLLLIGSAVFATQFAPRLRPYRNVGDIVYAERFAARPPLVAVMSDSDVRQEWGEAARRAFCEHAYTLREIGTHLGRPVATVWAWIQRAERESGEEASLVGRGSGPD
jgi:hypothetical protein